MMVRAHGTKVGVIVVAFLPKLTRWLGEGASQEQLQQVVRSPVQDGTMSMLGKASASSESGLKGRGDRSSTPTKADAPLMARRRDNPETVPTRRRIAHMLDPEGCMLTGRS